MTICPQCLQANGHHAGCPDETDIGREPEEGDKEQADDPPGTVDHGPLCFCHTCMPTTPYYDPLDDPRDAP